MRFIVKALFNILPTYYDKHLLRLKISITVSTVCPLTCETAIESNSKTRTFNVCRWYFIQKFNMTCVNLTSSYMYDTFGSLKRYGE